MLAGIEKRHLGKQYNVSWHRKETFG